MEIVFKKHVDGVACGNVAGIEEGIRWSFDIAKADMAFRDMLKDLC